VAVGIHRKRYTTPPYDALEQEEVTLGILSVSEEGVGNRTCGVVHRQQHGEHRPPALQPRVVAAVELKQHPLLRHPLAPAPVARRAAVTRTGQSGPH